MIKATAIGKEDGRTVLILGFSHANLERLRADGLKGFVKIKGEEVGIPIDIVITAGPTESAIVDALQGAINEDTVIHKSDRYRESEGGAA